VWNIESGETLGSLVKSPFGNQKADDLAQEEGITLGGVVELRHNRSVHGLACCPFNKVMRLRFAESMKRDEMSLALKICKHLLRALRTAGLRRTVRCDHHDSRLSQAPHKKSEQKKGIDVGAVKIVQYDYERPRLAYSIQKVRHRIE